MTVTFRCPNCDQTVTAALAPAMPKLECSQCGASTTVPEGSMCVAEGGAEIAPSSKGSKPQSRWQLHRCLVCPSRDLFVRKDFPQRLGIAIVVVGFDGFLAANYFYLKYMAFGFLFSTALFYFFFYFNRADIFNCCCFLHRLLWPGLLWLFRSFCLFFR